MNEISLINSTGNPPVDGILRGVVGLFEMMFPNRIRGYYLCGSYSDGTAIPALSDLDVSIVFKGKLEDSEENEFQRLLADNKSLDCFCPLPPCASTSFR